MSNIKIDDTHWPIVVVTTIGVCSDQEFESYLSWMTKSLQRKTRVVTIIDLSQAGRTPKHQRQHQTSWMQAHKEALSLYSAGTAFVFTSPVFRFILSSIFLVQSPPGDYCVVGTIEEARVWAYKQLGITESPLLLG
jgi:hypothetical protein